MKRIIGSTKDFVRFNATINTRLLDICGPLFENFGFSNFGYTRYLSDGSRMVLETNTKWFELYSQLEFHEKLEGPSSLLYNVCSAMRSESREVYTNLLIGPPKTSLHETLFSLDIWNSVSIYVKSKKYIEVFHLSTSRNNEDIVNFYINRQDLLQRFIYYFRDKLRDINISDAPYTVPSVAQNSFGTGPETSADFIDDFVNRTAISKFYLLTHDVFISRRETECLHYLALGKTAKEIAKELGLSPRTVESYLNGLKSKFSLLTKNDLIRLAYENNVHSFIPQHQM